MGGAVGAQTINKVCTGDTQRVLQADGNRQGLWRLVFLDDKVAALIGLRQGTESAHLGLRVCPLDFSRGQKNRRREVLAVV